MEIREQFIEEALKEIHKDWDVSREGWQFESVMNKYGNYFTFSKSSNEEDVKNTSYLIEELFVYLFPEIGGSNADYLSSAIAKASRSLNLTLEINQDCLDMIKEEIDTNALNPLRAYNNLSKYGLNLF
jgi:hypothetical protein